MFAFLIGASTGSFVALAGWRLPRDLSIVSPRSYCESCERAIPWFANIPILAYIGLRGRCVMCGATIPARHFLAELSMGIAGVYLYASFDLPDAIARFALCAALWVIAIVDYDWRLIPNVVTFPGMVVGFMFAAFEMPEVGWKSAAIGIVFGAGLLFITGEFYQMVRGREGVGMGDVWMLGMVGAFLGWQGVAFTLFFGSLLGAVGGIAVGMTGGVAGPQPPADPVGDPVEADISILRTEVPFGPFLALAAAAFALFQPQLLHWYLSRG